jgi:hypothetical protein
MATALWFYSSDELVVVVAFKRSGFKSSVVQEEQVAAPGENDS